MFVRSIRRSQRRGGPRRFDGDATTPLARKLWSRALGIGLAIALYAPCASAQSATASVVPPAPPASVTRLESNRTLARQMFLRGDVAYREGRYEASIELFRDAYRLSGRPLLLFNIANAYERLAQLPQAVEVLQAFLPSAGNEAPDIRRRIAALTERIERERREHEQLEEERMRLARAAREAEEAAARARAQPTTPPPSRAISARGPVLLGLGGAVLLVAGGFGIGARTIDGVARERCEANTPQPYCRVDASGPLAEASRDAIIADVGFGIGAALGVTGLTLLIVDVLRRPSSAAAAAPRVGLGPQGPFVRGSF